MTLRIPRPLRAMSGGADEILVQADTVGEALERGLDPALVARIRDSLDLARRRRAQPGDAGLAGRSDDPGSDPPGAHSDTPADMQTMGDIRHTLILYLDQVAVDSPDGLATRIADGGVLAIVPAVAGAARPGAAARRTRIP